MLSLTSSGMGVMGVRAASRRPGSRVWGPAWAPSTAPSPSSMPSSRIPAPAPFRAVVSNAGLDDHVWTPRELRHSFVSLMSDAGVPLEEISRLVGHRSTTVTEAVYRKQLRPVLTEGTEAMDRLFRASDRPTDRSDEPPKSDR